MEYILNKTTLFNTAIDIQKYITNKEYRWFTYVTKLGYKDIILLFNTLSRQMLCLTEEEYTEIENNTRNHLYKQLVEDYFLVPNEYNDFKLKEQYISLIPLFDNQKGITGYTILSTTECNARCFYCYERDVKKYPMSDKTAADVADFIIKKSLGQKVSIRWFGGEPLYNQSPIDIITDKLRTSGLEFKSQMTSNGYLFDKETVKKAKNNWNLKTVQITLDGTEKVYNRCKNYIYKTDESAFYRVLDNIRNLLDAEIRVTIRINMDRHNKDDLYALIDILSERFNSHLLSVYTFLLFDNFNLTSSVRAVDDRKELIEEQIKIESYIEEKGLATKSLPSKQLKINYCMADNEQSTTVLPDGHLGKCEHYSDHGFWGSICSDEIDYDVINSWKEKREPVELCKTCPLVPQCYHLKKCPDDTYDCDEYVQAHRLSKLHRQMKNAYDKYLKENKE